MILSRTLASLHKVFKETVIDQVNFVLSFQSASRICIVNIERLIKIVEAILFRNRLRQSKFIDLGLSVKNVLLNIIELLQILVRTDV